MTMLPSPSRLHALRLSSARLTPGKVALPDMPRTRYPPFQHRCERNQRRRDLPSSLIRYSRVPRPLERLSSRPKLQSLLKYVQAERAGEKLSLSAASFGPSHSPWVAANKDRTCSLSSLYRFILFSDSPFL